MSYAIIRNANYKKANLAGLYKHNERKNINYSNKDIVKEKSRYNYSIKKCNTTYANALKILQEKNNLQGRIIKTTNVVCEFIITSSKEFFEKIGEEETKRYFQTVYNFVVQYQNLGEQYILSATVHMDENTPHLHLVFIPVVHKLDKKSGKQIDKIACSEYWKGKDSYRKLQDAFYKYITENGFKLERGQQRDVDHLSTEKLKQVTDYDNIKYEITHEGIQPLETKNRTLIVQQNKELIQYTNKLKLQLSKSINVVQRVEELQIENNVLKQENETLKRKNHTLLKYINKAIDLVYLWFNFPKDSFQYILNHLVNDKDNKEK